MLRLFDVSLAEQERSTEHPSSQRSSCPCRCCGRDPTPRHEPRRAVPQERSSPPPVRTTIRAHGRDAPLRSWRRANRGSAPRRTTDPDRALCHDDESVHTHTQSATRKHDTTRERAAAHQPRTATTHAARVPCAPHGDDLHARASDTTNKTSTSARIVLKRAMIAARITQTLPRRRGRRAQTTSREVAAAAAAGRLTWPPRPPRRAPRRRRSARPRPSPPAPPAAPPPRWSRAPTARRTSSPTARPSGWPHRP